MPSRKTNLLIQPPLGGVNRKVGFQNQPPFTSYESINFWPIDTITGRSITSTRPPIIDADSPGTPGEPINLLCRINGVASGKPLQSMIAAREGDLYWWDGDSWVAATGAQADDIPTGIPLYAAPYLQEVFIPQPNAKPIVFDYVTGAAATLVESAGTIPNDLRMFIVWQGAVWGAGSLTTPHILYASRTGDGHDWNFAVPLTDEGGAFFTGGENEGLLRGPITALIPHTSDTMIVSTTEGLVAFRAHPRRGGVVEDLSGGAWIMGQGAWAKGPGDSTFFLTRLGMMVIGPEANSIPTQISRDKVPDELVGLAYDYENPVISMVYDSRWNGILITVRGEQEQAWWYDLQAGGFHEMTMDDYPFVMIEFFPFVTTNKSGILMGGAGYNGIGQFDRLGSEDFEASITIGPVQISPHTHAASIIQRAVVTFAGDTPTTDGTIYFATGLDGEDVITRLDNDVAQFSQGLIACDANNGVCYPKAAGHAAAVKIVQANGRCAIEQISLSLDAAGLNRMTRFKNTLRVACFGYVTATPNIPAPTEFGDGLEAIDMSLFPEEWWDLTNDDGGNIRVSDENNNFLPFDLVGYQKFEEEVRVDNGAIIVRRPLSTTVVPLRVWVCDENLAKFPLGSQFGQYATYPPWMLAVWPNSYGPSRTAVAWPISDGETPATPDLVNPFGSTPPGGSGSPESCGDVPPGVYMAACIAFPLDAESGTGIYVGADNASPCTADESPTAAAAWVDAHNDPEASGVGAVRLASEVYTVLEAGPNAPDIESHTPFAGRLTLGAVGSFVAQANDSTLAGGGLSAEPHPTVSFGGPPPAMDAEAIEAAFGMQDVYNMSTAFGVVATSVFDAAIYGFLIAQIDDNAAYWGDWEFVESTQRIG